MRNNHLVSVIIINWNGKHWLLKCLPSLQKQDYRNIEIIIVDNGSTDGSVQWIKKNYPEIVIIRNGENLGFAQSNNQGFRKAKGKYVVFLNNDTTVTKPFITELIKILERDPSIAGAQSKLLLMDDHTRLDAVGAFLTGTGFLYHWGFHAKDTPSLDKEIELYTAKGACMIFRKNVLDKVAIHGNIFDPLYFAYFEETDLCHRVWLAGYRIVYASKSVIYHKAGGTSTGMVSAFIQYHSFKNRIQSYLTNLGVPALIRIMPLHIALTLGFAASAVLRGRFRLGVAVVRSVTWNISRIRGTLKKRKFVQSKIRVLPDKELFGHIMKNPGFGYYRKLVSGLSLYQT